jgi:hypothetical protein
MRITFNERPVGDDLTDFFRRCDCVVEQVASMVLRSTLACRCLPMPRGSRSRACYASGASCTPR